MEQQLSSNQNNQTNPANSTLVDMQRFQKKKSRTGKKILLVLILCAIILAAAYYFFFLNKNNAEPVAPENNSSVSENENKIDKNLDTDQDSLPDYMEKFLSTNPNNPDTDGDGYNDLEEIKNGYSPLIAGAEGKYTAEEWDNVKGKIKIEDREFYEKEFEIVEINSSFNCGVNTVVDIDNNIYNTVKIGDQCWLKENLKVTKNPAGEAITRYCYDNDDCNTTGGFYAWDTAMNDLTHEGAQGICPNGWQIPKDNEWYVLENYLKDSGETCDENRDKIFDCDGAGEKIKKDGSSGFEALLVGARNPEGNFVFVGSTTSFWSSTENESKAWIRNFPYGSSSIFRFVSDKKMGNSIRCIKSNYGDVSDSKVSSKTNCEYKKGKYEARFYDSSGRVTGLINGEIKEEIPDSIYNEETGDVLVFNTKDTYVYEIYDIEEGNYKMEHSSVVDGRSIIFKAQNIPIYPGQTHRYKIDWEVLAKGEDGVSVLIDADGDGKFEKTINADIKLSCEEFNLKMGKE